jgi:hypothetical protein
MHVNGVVCWQRLQQKLTLSNSRNFAICQHAVPA